jgi:hypothetical protein
MTCFSSRPHGFCPFGFTCGEEFMANCTQLRSSARDAFQIGRLRRTRLYSIQNNDKPLTIRCSWFYRRYLCGDILWE